MNGSSRVHPEDIERVQSEILSHLLGYQISFRGEHRVRRAAEAYRWMLSAVGRAGFEQVRLSDDRFVN